VNTANDWHMAIRTLLNDEEYRQDLVYNLAEDVREHFNHSKEVEKLKTHVNKLV
jgi:predicted house-cleaning noncanonical NTP pyrophosphatase (MazG superfamily)